ncbi:hypothetical protein C8R47DRAFT_1230812 [Mycena vitilis]|nr:hypothetical protein C8R47DRAFT_1230812 [Mycena vitilis]
MPRGRPPKDPETKATRRQAALQRYATKNADSLRASARSRMQALRSRRALDEVDNDGPSAQSLRAKASAAKYRESHREGIREADRLRRARSYIKEHGVEAFDEKRGRGYMTKTQKLHEGHSPAARVRPPLRKRLDDAPAMRPPFRKRFDPHEVLTENQKRCRALRACRFEEDNGDDSDEDLPPGTCGCDRTECQRLHKNETKDRHEWKIFHLKYAKELEAGF